MLIARTDLAQTALTLQSVRFPTVVVTIGHSAPTIGLFRADVDCNFLAARIDLALLLCVHELLISSEGVNGHSHPVLRRSHSQGLGRAIARVAQLTIGQYFGFLREVWGTAEILSVQSRSASVWALSNPMTAASICFL